MIKKFQLKNGLDVILVPSNKSPVVSVQMWVRAGSADEGKGEEGLSHFIEHLVFKGTQKYKVGEIASLVEGSGGELNAYTSFDQTVFYVTISKDYFSTGLDVIAQMMGFPLFDPQEIDNEREVVIEEIKRGLDSLGRQASQALFQTAYKKSAYRIPVIGYEKNIRTVSAKKIRSYFESRYTPQNMFLVVAGDFETSDAKKRINETFSQFKKNKLKKIKRTKEPTQNQPRVHVKTTSFEQSICYSAWKIPGANHKDIPALDVLALILGQGDSSRLVKKLRLEAPLVSSVGTGSYLPLEGGLFMLSLGLEKEKWPQIYPILTDEIKKIQIEGPTLAELEKAIINLESGEYYSIETVDGLARRYGAVEFQFKDLKRFDRYFKELRLLTTGDIQRVAQKYLTAKTLSVAFTTKAKENEIKPEIKKWIKNLNQELKPAKKIKAEKIKIKKMPKLKSSVGKNKLELIELESGARAIFRASTETAVVSAKTAFMGGLRYESMQEEGLSELFSRVWISGTRKKNENEILEEADRIAAGITPIVGRNSVGLSLDVLKNFEKEGAELFFESLFYPSFSGLAVDREKVLQVQQIQHKVDNPTQIAFNHFLKAMFFGHPYSKDTLGSADKVKSISLADLQGYWSRVFKPNQMHFVFAGNVDKDFWIEKINIYMKEHLKNKSDNKAHLSLSLSELTDSKYAFEKSQKEQAHLIHGFRSLPLNHNQRHTLQIIQAILAGQGGRLFLELRDKESLAYSVSPTRLEGIEAGYFGAYIGCSPEKTKKAYEMMQIEFEKLCQNLVSKSELDRAKRYTIGRHDIDLQRTAAIGSALLYEDLYGLDYVKEVFNYAEIIHSISAEDIIKLSQQLFQKPTVTVIVGPESSNLNLGQKN